MQAGMNVSSASCPSGNQCGGGGALGWSGKCVVLPSIQTTEVSVHSSGWNYTPPPSTVTPAKELLFTVDKPHWPAFHKALRGHPFREFFILALQMNTAWILTRCVSGGKYQTSQTRAQLVSISRICVTKFSLLLFQNASANLGSYCEKENKLLGSAKMFLTCKLECWAISDQTWHFHLIWKQLLGTKHKFSSYFDCHWIHSGSNFKAAFLEHHDGSVVDTSSWRKKLMEMKEMRQTKRYFYSIRPKWMVTFRKYQNRKILFVRDVLFQPETSEMASVNKVCCQRDARHVNSAFSSMSDTHISKNNACGDLRKFVGGGVHSNGNQEDHDNEDHDTYMTPTRAR